MPLLLVSCSQFGTRFRRFRCFQGYLGRRPGLTLIYTDRMTSKLVGTLRQLDGSSYGAYKRVVGSWEFPSFTVHIDRVQSDPYAPPSAVRITAPGLPELTTAEQQLAAADFLVRNFPRTRDIGMAGAGQEILERSAASVSPERIELRLQVRLPARGRTILGRLAAEIFGHALPEAVAKVLRFAEADYAQALTSQVNTYVDHQFLQRLLPQRGWVGFIADGAVLARESGVSQRPLADSVPFESPESLRVSVDLPHAGTVSGMAIPKGLTLIVGGGYHGKSTVLSALQRGVYAHIPGDGRELVVAVPEAVKVRAADGRPITRVDVSPFINHLPTGASTEVFSTKNASGSTSQAASIVEAVQGGTSLLLIDEDTSATNLMIRDERMRALVSAAQEPITPLVDRVAALAKDVSLIMVMGGSGAYLDVADRVLQMDAYRCVDVTERAREVAALVPREITEFSTFPPLTPRRPVRLRSRADRPKTRSTGVVSFSLDREDVNIADVEQIVDPGQAEAIAWAVRGIVEHLADSELTVVEVVQKLEALLSEQGLDALSRFGARKFPAFLVRPRAIDVAAALNRYRPLQIK